MTLTRSVRIWLAVDVLLVIVLLVLVVTTSGGSSGPDANAPTGTSTTTTTSAQPASTAPVAVRLPSGNIACALSDDGVTCTIASITFDPPAVAGCSGETGHVIVLNDDGVAFACETGPAPTVAGEDVRTLPYGSDVTVGQYTCTSATNGVTCVDGDGKGFRLARAAWTEIG